MVLIFSVVKSKEYVLSGDYEACNSLPYHLIVHISFLYLCFCLCPEAQLTLVF